MNEASLRRAHAYPHRKLLTLRFSLRAMLVVIITIGYVPFGRQANRLLDNQQAIESFQQITFTSYKAANEGK
jgi:hypothetical protein